MGFISRLEAVNRILTASGFSRVSDLEGQSGIDTAQAEAYLDEASVDLQQQGLAINQAYRTVTPNSEGLILVEGITKDSLGLIECTLVSQHQSLDGYRIEARLSESETTGTLWNMTDNTAIWDQSQEYTLRIVYAMPWEQFTTPCQLAAVAMAARKFQALTQGDEQADRYLAEREILAIGIARSTDTRAKDRNILHLPEALRITDRWPTGSVRNPRMWR